MKHRLNGFLVVRKPEDCGVLFNNKWCPQPAVIEGRKYFGLSRCPWQDIELIYFRSGLEPKWEKLYKNIEKASKEHLFAMELSQSEEEAKKILSFSTQISKEKNELIAIYSSLLSELQGDFESEAKIDWIGYDLFEIGSSSLIRIGIFSCKEFFNEWKKNLNKHGLLNEKTNDLKENLIKDFEFFQKKKMIETRPILKKYTDFFKIGLIK